MTRYIPTGTRVVCVCWVRTLAQALQCMSAYICDLYIECMLHAWILFVSMHVSFVYGFPGCKLSDVAVDVATMPLLWFGGKVFNMAWSHDQGLCMMMPPVMKVCVKSDVVHPMYHSMLSVV